MVAKNKISMTRAELYVNGFKKKTLGTRTVLCCHFTDTLVIVRNLLKRKGISDEYENRKLKYENTSCHVSKSISILPLYCLMSCGFENKDDEFNRKVNLSVSQ